MADEFHAGLCSTMDWWDTMRTTPSFDFPQPPTISCSSTESLSWSTTTQQPFLPAELSQIQAGFGDSWMVNDQTWLPGLFESIDPLRDVSDSWGSSSPELSRVSSPSKQQLTNFANKTPFWNPSSDPSVPAKIPNESSSSNLITIKPSESEKNGNSDQPAAKKPRIATPSPLPTFKVRKEKLGDRITALQQLVSPFGKTDTASVLHEAIDYIKFLHGQVDALSSPYLKNGHQMQRKKGNDSSSDEGRVRDLRSRGLCLVPICSTFAVASENPIEFWAPTFLEAYK